MSIVIPIIFSIGFAFAFYLVSSLKLNLLTRIVTDIVLGFFTPLVVYVVMFFVTNGNIPHYVFPLFCGGFFVTLSFLYPKKNKEKKK